MKTLVTCDDVFAVLTRGPFPAGHADDGDVELHLQACHECRQIAEAMRPAVRLFHEAINAQESDANLPAYRGKLADPAALSSRHLQPWQHSDGGLSRLTSWATAACLLLCIASGFAAGYRVSSSDNAVSVRAPQPVGTEDHPRAHALATLSIPQACRAHDVDADQRRSAEDGYQCCTRCHAAKQARDLPHLAIMTLAKSCLACHSTPGSRKGTSKLS